MKILPEPIAFEWDKGNIDKNLLKHKVTNKEVEEVFGNRHFMIEDKKHSTDYERRYLLWGITNDKRKLTVIFTIRTNRIRIISARDMNNKERRQYEKIETDS